MSMQARRSYRPGDWFGIFGDNALVLLPPSEKARVAALWELVDDGAGFDEVLDALLSSGLRDLPGFVLVSELEHATKVVLRGPAVATFVADGGPMEVAGAVDTTWVERSLPGVVAMAIQVDPAAQDEGESLTIGSGLVRLARFEQPAVTGGIDDTADPVGAQDADDVDGGAEVEDEGVVHEEVPLGEVADLPLVEDVGDAEPEPAAGTPIWAPQPEAGPVARLLFSNGDVVEVDRMILVGRAPEAHRYTLTEEPLLVTVTSPQQEISSTHLEVRPGSGADLGSAMVTDLGSTNGTVLIQPGQQPEDLHPGISVALVPGAIIDLGDGVSIQVTRP